MPDEVLLNNLNEIVDSAELILNRFSRIVQPEDFVQNSDGVLLLDSICMRLQIIGEITKKIHKSHPNVLNSYPQIQWPNIMKLRDIISHHYDHVDYQLVYDICKKHLFPLMKAVRQIITDTANPPPYSR